MFGCCQKMATTSGHVTFQWAQYTVQKQACEHLATAAHVSDNSASFECIVAFPPVRERLKRGASNQARNRKRTSVYSSWLSNTRNSRKSSHASPSSLVATQHRGKSISVAVSRHATIAATFSERSALSNSTQR
jgi:hypothetical protein